MSDVTQGQDAPTAQPVPDKPDVDTLFAARDVDELFPSDYKPTDQPVRNVSPIQDMIFSNPGRAHARILDAFGYGFKQDWGAGQAEFSEADEYLRKAGVYNDYAKGQRNIIKAANEVIMRPAVASLLAAKSTISGAFHGAQEAVAQTGAEVGAPQLGREIASIPEAFPTGLHQMAGIPHVPDIVTTAKSLDTIGSGEAGYFGTAPVEAETAKTSTEAAKVQDAAQPESVTGQGAETPPSPVAQPAAPAAEPHDIHTVARQIAPETFQEFDSLAQKKDTFRRWISELRETRDQTVAEGAPHQAEITELQGKIEDATPRLAKKYQARLEPLVAERDAYIAERAQGDSADMAKIRQQLMTTDYRMRDLAPDVAKAYRDAQERMPQPETPAAEATAHDESPAEAVPEQVPVAGETAAEPAEAAAAAPDEVKPAKRTKKAAAAAQPEVLIKTAEKGAQFAGKQAIAPDTDEAADRLPIAHAPSIVADVSQKLQAAGRPVPEAEAAAQVVAAYWETRARRFKGAKGTAAEMYEAEAPEIVAGKEKPSKAKKARELELAQNDKQFFQSEPKLLPALKYRGKVFKGEQGADHLEIDIPESMHDELTKFGLEDVRELPGVETGFVNHKGQFLDHSKAGSYAIDNGLVPEKFTAYHGNDYIRNGGLTSDMLPRKEFEQNTAGVKGRIRVRDDARNTITLMKTADASTFIHETGHDWLERMLDDARDEDAPPSLRADSATVMKWLGVDSPDAIKTRHHERFARGFETYMMEGRAPTQALARVFAKFKAWLTNIYRTVAALKAPISDDIRGVFDRLLTETPEKTVIAPEIETKSGIAETHEGLAETTPPERSHAVANTVETERDSHADRTLVKAGDHDTRLSDTGAEVEGRAPRGAQSASDADASGALSGRSEESGGAGALGTGRSEAAAEGAGVRKESERLNKPPTPLLQFIASRGGISASDALISDLRQSLGAKNSYVPGHGQLIRAPKQLSSAARKAGRSAAMTMDRAREAAIEAGLLPEGASITDFLDAIDQEVRGNAATHNRPNDPAELAHAEHNFLEGINDVVKDGGGTELSDVERKRALELWRQEGLNDPAQIIERLALEADDAEIANGAPDRIEGIPGWDVAAPGWDTFDERPGASGASDAAAAGQSEQSGSGAARSGSVAQESGGLSPTADLPRSETHLIDKAGNIRLDNLNAPEDVKEVIRATAVANDDFLAERRNVISDGTALKLADALGMDAGQLSMRKLGEAFNEEQIIASANLLIKSAANVRDLAAKIAGGTDADVLAYAEANQRHLMIQGQFHGVTAEAGRALHAFKILKKLQDLKGAKELGGAMKDLTGKTLYQMKEEGALLAMMETPQQVSKAVHDANLTTWQKTRAGVLSWFINDLISGPITHAGYTVGNTVTQLFKATVDTSVAATMGMLRGLPPGERVHFGEVGAQLYGMVRGMRDGYAPALTALKTGVPFMKGDVDGMLGQIEAAYRPQAIPGKLGYVLETPSRAVTMIHTMHYSMNYESEIARRAFRSAMKDGLDPGSTEFNTKIADFTQSPPATEMQAAHDEAIKMVLMKSAPFGTAQYHLQKAVNGNILAKIVMPFMQVGANILHESFIERTPLGVMSQTVRDNMMGKNGEIARQTQASRIAVGIGISTAVVGLTAEGILTGGGPSDHRQLAIKEMTGWKPYSIRVGEFYVPYRKYLGGMGPLIAGTADIYEVGHTLSEEGLTKAAAGALFGFAEVIADESWAKGLANFIDAARHWDRDGGKYLRGLAMNFIPASVGLQQVATVADPYRREVHSMLDAARAHIPGLSQGLFPQRDIWGEPMQSHTALGPSAVVNDRATQALLDAGFYPARLARKVRGVELSDQQYDDLTRTGGRMAKMQMNALVNTPGFASMPKQFQANKIKEIIDGARESARSIILMQNPDIITKANAAKTAKLRGEPVH